MKSKEEILNAVIIANTISMDSMIQYSTALAAMEEYTSQYTTAQTEAIVGQFIDLVVEMRELQRRYAYGDRGAVRVQEKIEKEVDYLLSHIKTQQENLL